MSALYDFSCIMFQDSPFPIKRSYAAVASLKEAVQNRWAYSDYDHDIISSKDAETYGWDTHGIEWVKVSNSETGAIIEVFVAYEVKEHVPPLGIVHELDHACGNVCISCGGPGL